jgi:hypothetical protein
MSACDKVNFLRASLLPVLPPAVRVRTVQVLSGVRFGYFATFQIVNKYFWTNQISYVKSIVAILEGFCSEGFWLGLALSFKVNITNENGVGNGYRMR